MRSLSLLSSLSLFLLSLPRPATAACCSHPGWNLCQDGTPVTPCCGYLKCNGFCCHCEGANIVPVPVTIWNGIDEAGKIISTSMMTAPPGSSIYCRSVEHSVIRGRVATFSEKYGVLGDPQHKRRRRGALEIESRTAGEGVEGVRVGEAPATPTTLISDNKETLRGSEATVAVEAPFQTPMPASANPASPGSSRHSEEVRDHHHENAYCDSVFHSVSNSTGKIDLPAYLAFFGLQPEEQLLERGLGVDFDEVRGVTRDSLREIFVRHFFERDVDGDGVLGREEVEALL